MEKSSSIFLGSFLECMPWTVLFLMTVPLKDPHIHLESNMSSKASFFFYLLPTVLFSHCCVLKLSDIRDALCVPAQASKSISFSPGQSQSLQCDCSSHSTTTHCQNVFHSPTTITADNGISKMRLFNKKAKNNNEHWKWNVLLLCTFTVILNLNT